MCTYYPLKVFSYWLVKIKEIPCAKRREAWLSPSQIYPTRYESVFYGIKALSYGLPISLAINYLLYRIMSDGFQFSFTLPWDSYIVAMVSVFALVFVTMLYSSSKIKQENIIDSLKSENI